MRVKQNTNARLNVTYTQKNKRYIRKRCAVNTPADIRRGRSLEPKAIKAEGVNFPQRKLTIGSEYRPFRFGERSTAENLPGGWCTVEWRWCTVE